MVYETVGVRPSVRPVIRPQQRRAAGLLPSAPPGRRYQSIDSGAAARRSAANLGLCHVDSRVDEAEHRIVASSECRSTYV